jgi:hypothetical protein
MEDLRHVPVLASELGGLGLLSGISQEQVEAYEKSKSTRTRGVLAKVSLFLEHLGRDERAFVALLVRAAAIINELLALDDELQSMFIDMNNLDRWLWLTMRKAVKLTMMKPTFRLDKDALGWLTWLKELHKALMAFDCDRFERMQGLRKGWEKKGWLQVNYDTTGLNEDDLAQRDSEYRGGLGQAVVAPNEYRQQQSEKVRKERDRIRIERGAWPTITQDNVIMVDEDALIVSDTDGTIYPQDPVTEEDLAGAYRRKG